MPSYGKDRVFQFCPQNQRENRKVTQSLFTLESGVSKVTIRAYLDNFEQVRLGKSCKLSNQMVTDSAAGGSISFAAFGGHYNM